MNLKTMFSARSQTQVDKAHIVQGLLWKTISSSTMGTTDLWCQEPGWWSPSGNSAQEEAWGGLLRCQSRCVSGCCVSGCCRPRVFTLWKLCHAVHYKFASFSVCMPYFNCFKKNTQFIMLLNILNKHILRLPWPTNPQGIGPTVSPTSSSTTFHL